MAEHSESVATLNTLIATTIDSINGYEDSAKNIDNERLREIFRQRASEERIISRKNGRPPFRAATCMARHTTSSSVSTSR